MVGQGQEKNEKPIKTDRQDRKDRKELLLLDLLWLGSVLLHLFLHSLTFAFSFFVFSNKNIDTLIGFACTRTTSDEWPLFRLKRFFADRKGGGDCRDGEKK